MLVATFHPLTDINFVSTIFKRWHQRILVAVCNWCISTLATALWLHCLDPGNPSIHVQ